MRAARAREKARRLADANDDGQHQEQHYHEDKEGNKEQEEQLEEKDGVAAGGGRGDVESGRSGGGGGNDGAHVVVDVVSQRRLLAAERKRKEVEEHLKALEAARKQLRVREQRFAHSIMPPHSPPRSLVDSSTALFISSSIPLITPLLSSSIPPFIHRFLVFVMRIVSSCSCLLFFPSSIHSFILDSLSFMERPIVMRSDTNKNSKGSRNNNMLLALTSLLQMMLIMIIASMRRKMLRICNSDKKIILL